MDDLDNCGLLNEVSDLKKFNFQCVSHNNCLSNLKTLAEEKGQYFAASFKNNMLSCHKNKYHASSCAGYFSGRTRAREVFNEWVLENLT